DVERFGGAARLRAIWGASAREVYAVGDGGTLVRSTGDGRWTELHSAATICTACGGRRPTRSTWWARCRCRAGRGRGPDDVYVVGSGGAAQHTGDGGRTWATVTLPSHDGYSGIWGSGAKDVYIVGGAGEILHGHE